MAIHSSGTFEYHGVAPLQFPVSHGIDLVQTSLPSDTLSNFPDEHRRLVGFNPRLEFDGDQAIIRALPNDHAACSTFSFFIPKQVWNLINPNDEVHLVRTRSANLGVSVTRGEQLVFAFGAVCSLPLGQVSVYHSRRIRKWESSEAPDKRIECYLEFVFGNDKNRRVHDGEAAKIHGYSIFVRNTFLMSCPGEDECAFVLSEDVPFELDAVAMTESFRNQQNIHSAEAKQQEEPSSDSRLDKDWGYFAREALQQYIKDQRQPPG